MSPVLSSSMAAGDADACCMAPFPTAMVNGVDMAASGLPVLGLAVLWRKQPVEVEVALCRGGTKERGHCASTRRERRNADKELEDSKIVLKKAPSRCLSIFFIRYIAAPAGSRTRKSRGRGRESVVMTMWWFFNSHTGAVRRVWVVSAADIRAH